jgi:hypothetical protein
MQTQYFFKLQNISQFFIFSVGIDKFIKVIKEPNFFE